MLTTSNLAASVGEVKGLDQAHLLLRGVQPL